MVDEKDLNEGEQEMTVTSTLGDDAEVEYVVLTTFNAGECKYIALLPMEGADPEGDEVHLYHYSKIENGTPSLGNIEGGDEYEIVAETLGELLDAQEYDELVDKAEGEQSG